MERIGVVGLGRMGAAIAGRFAAQGLSVTGWTRSGRQVDGIQSAADLAELTDRADVLILSLFDGEAVADTLDALLALDLDGKLILDTSTVIPQIIQSRATALAARGAQICDTPISGGPEMVHAGVCGVFIGGDDAAAARAEAVLAHLTPRCLTVGPLGTGMVMKTINNAAIQIYCHGLSELLPMAKRAGLPLERVMQILNGGPAGLPMVRDRMAKVLGDDPSVGFPMSGIAKDNAVFQAVASAYGVETPALAVAGQGHADALQDGFADKDPAAVIAAAYHDA